MISSPIRLYRSEVENALDDVQSSTPWNRLSASNRRRIAIIILRQRIDLPSAALADLLVQGSAVADAFNIIEDLTAF